jgi:hypothetical protein
MVTMITSLKTEQETRTVEGYMGYENISPDRAAQIELARIRGLGVNPVYANCTRTKPGTLVDFGTAGGWPTYGFVVDVPEHAAATMAKLGYVEIQGLVNSEAFTPPCVTV